MAAFHPNCSFSCKRDLAHIMLMCENGEMAAGSKCAFCATFIMLRALSVLECT